VVEAAEPAGNGTRPGASGPGEVRAWLHDYEAELFARPLRHTSLIIAAKSWHHMSAAHSLPFTISVSRSTRSVTALPIAQNLPARPD
jgi:hypothetical protein